MIYTPKQRGLMMRWKQNRLHRLNLLEGSVSSGKTWISLVLWAFWVATMPMDKLYDVREIPHHAQAQLPCTVGRVSWVIQFCIFSCVQRRIFVWQESSFGRRK
ncbi:hypothetical protein BN3661_01509 [Eubacteriaceae bacterium CHKCI005]|nr:hypothetical protein BN3661_01509 [Eubacteriaceae bacterium CHKCI005]